MTTTAEPRQLSEKETYEQCLRALHRLRDKRLICGEVRFAGLCCAIGALDIHAANSDVVTHLDFYAVYRAQNSPQRFLSNRAARFKIMSANDSFRKYNNSLPAQRARYKYMVRWLNKQIASMA